MNKLISAFLLSLIPLTSFAKTEEKQERSFRYSNVGIGSFLIMPYGIDVAFGKRVLYGGGHSWDRQIGAGLGAYGQLLYVQSSYLHYTQTKFPCTYFGVGLTLGIVNFTNDFTYIFGQGLSPLINIPFTVGYQFEDDDFMQLQITPFLTVTATYGYSF